MNKSVRYGKVKVVNEKTRLPTEQLVANSLRKRDDLIKDKSFLRCRIQGWDKFAKLCDEQLGTDLLLLVSMLILETLDEFGTSEGQLCQSDNDDFTIIDHSAVMPKIRKQLQLRFTPQALEQEPYYIYAIKKQGGGEKIPTSLRFVTEIITANDFLQIEN